MGGPVVMVGDNLPSSVEIGLTDQQNIRRASGPPGPPGSGITAEPKEPENWSKTDQNIIFLSEMILHFRPICAG